MHRLTIIFLLIVFSFNLSKGNGSIVIKFKDTKIYLQTIKKKNIEYLKLSDLKKIFINNSNLKIENNTIYYDREELTFSDLSFFVAYKNQSVLRIAQLTSPCIEFDNELFIPIISFFKGMDAIDLIKSIKMVNFINISNYNIFNLPMKIEPKPLTKIKINKNPQLDTSKTDLDSLDNKNIPKPNKLEFEKEDSNLRGKYTIPKNLKK